MGVLQREVRRLTKLEAQAEAARLNALPAAARAPALLELKERYDAHYLAKLKPETEMTIDKIPTDAIEDSAVKGLKIAMGADVAGDILTHDGAAYVRLPKGTAGQVLRMNASATGVEWADESEEAISYSEPAAAASVELTTGFSANYDVYEIYYELVSSTNTVDLHVLFSTDTGATYKTGASDYRYSSWGKQDNSGAPQEFSTGASFIALNGANSVGNGSGQGISGSLRMIRPLSTDMKSFITFESSLFNSSGSSFHQHGNGSYSGNEAINALKLEFSAGLMTGKVLFRRLRNST